MAEKEKKSREKIPGRLPYALGNIASGTAIVLLSNLTYALTESYSMSAITVGTIMLVSRLFDGVTDIIAGFIIDNTKTKMGKARPFELLYIPLWITMILCFTVPYQLQTVGKIIWVFLTYNVCQSVCYTFITCIESVRLRRSFEEPVRVKIVSFSYLLVFIASFLVALTSPLLISHFQNVKYGWTIISSIYAVPFMICGLLRFILLKERDDALQEAQEVRPSIRGTLRALFSNPYAFVFAGISLIVGINSSFTSSNNYFYQYFLGDVALATIPGLFSSLGMVFLVFLPKVSKKLGTQKTIILGYVLMAVGLFARAIAPTSLPWLAFTTGLTIIGNMYISSMRQIGLIEVMTYGEWKTHGKSEAIYSSVSGMAEKMGLGLGGILIGAVMQFTGYDGNLSVQSASAMKGIHFLFIGMPGIVATCGALIMLFYNLEKKLPAIKEELATRTTSTDNQEPSANE